MNELALFAGAGGGILGGKLLGWRTVCAVEIEDYPRRVLMQRQNDGILEPFPIWDDIRTFDGKPWRGIVDVVSGGFPCQDISSAGKGAGLDGARSGLWTEMARVICEVRPRFVLVENSPMLVCRGLGRVLGDLAAMGFDADWGVLGAHHAGAPHKRDRIWILAHTNNNGHAKPTRRGGAAEAISTEQAGANQSLDAEGVCRLSASQGNVANASGIGFQGVNIGSINVKSSDSRIQPKFAGESGSDSIGWWSTEPGLGRVAHGVANRVDRIKAIGNGQVPAVVKLAWETLTRHKEDAK